MFIHIVKVEHISPAEQNLYKIFAAVDGPDFAIASEIFSVAVKGRNTPVFFNFLLLARLKLPNHISILSKYLTPPRNWVYSRLYWMRLRRVYQTALFSSATFRIKKRFKFFREMFLKQLVYTFFLIAHLCLAPSGYWVSIFLNCALLVSGTLPSNTMKTTDVSIFN